MNRGSERRLRELLNTRGLEWPAPIEWHEVIGSTNDRARELASAGAPTLTTVLADHQTAGRGRQGRTWQSPQGNLMASVVLRPRCEARLLGWLPLQAGVCVAEALDEFGAGATLKWPNDVEVGGRKLGGLLVEAAPRAGGCDWAVVGAGVNLRLDPVLCAGLASPATSIAEVTGQCPNVEAVAAAVLASIAAGAQRFSERPEGVAEAWTRRANGFVGSRVTVVREGEPLLEGRASGLDAFGGLLVETASGTVVAAHSGDVMRVRRAEDR